LNQKEMIRKACLQREVRGRGSQAYLILFRGGMFDDARCLDAIIPSLFYLPPFQVFITALGRDKRGQALFDLIQSECPYSHTTNAQPCGRKIGEILFS